MVRASARMLGTSLSSHRARRLTVERAPSFWGIVARAVRNDDRPDFRQLDNRHDRLGLRQSAYGYGGQSLLCCLPTNCSLTNRLVKEARLYGARLPRKAGTAGRTSDTSGFPRALQKPTRPDAQVDIAVARAQADRTVRQPRERRELESTAGFRQSVPILRQDRRR